MGNKRFQTHPGSGHKTGQKGPRHDSVSPEKTKAWPKVPGKTQPKDRSHGFARVKGAAASEGC
jgi:hypothetical protein